MMTLYCGSVFFSVLSNIELINIECVHEYILNFFLVEKFSNSALGIKYSWDSI